MDLLFPLLLLLLLFVPMILMSRRQKRAQLEHQKLLSALEIGDEVRTHSGFYGLIVEEYDDVVILETESGAHTKWARAAIAQRVDTDDRLGPLDGTVAEDRTLADGTLSDDPVAEERRADDGRDAR